MTGAGAGTGRSTPSIANVGNPNAVATRTRVVEDCVESRDEESHRRGLEQMGRAYGARIVPSAELGAPDGLLDLNGARP